MPDAKPRPLAQRLLIEDLVLRLRIGVGEAERAAPQRLLVSLAVEVEPSAPERDAVEEVVDYGAIAEAVRGLAGREVKLLETLAREIAALAFLDDRVRGVEITLRKPDLFEDVAAVGITQRFLRPAN